MALCGILCAMCRAHGNDDRGWGPTLDREPSIPALALQSQFVNPNTCPLLRLSCWALLCAFVQKLLGVLNSSTISKSGENGVSPW
eukprot:266157-Pleurochrysis_carterae.AAC.1